MGKSSIDQNGFRRQTANPVSLVGVFPYTGEQIDYDGAMGLDPKKVYWVFRPPEELFAPEALESFNGIPIRVGHVMLGDDFKAVDDAPVDGCIYNARQSLDMPEYLIAEFTIYTDKMKDILSKGKIKELSLGYRCQYVPCVGSYKGKPYQFKQVNLRGNHLALVEHGRCGSSVCVCDKALITFDSLPKEMEAMEDKDKKSLEKVQKLAEAVKNGDEQACQDCLDFYDLSPEQRKEALAYVKGKKKEEKKADAPTEDAKAKDGEIPPPPTPPPEEVKPREEEKPTEETPPPPPPPAEEKPAEEPPPEEEAPATDSKKKSTKDTAEGVTEPSVTVPKQNLEGAVTPKKDCDGKECGKKEAKDCGTKDAKCDDCGDKPATKDEKCDCKDESGDGKCDKCGKPLTEDKACKDEDKAEKKEEKEVPVEETEKVEEVVVGDAKDKLPPPEQDIPSKMPKEEGEQDIKANEKIAQDQYQAFAAEYAKAQDLAGKVRPLIKETFDSALMREVDVARFAAKHIPALSFAADSADAEVLAAVKGLIAHIAMDEAKKETKVFGMDEALPEKKEPKVQKDAKVRDTARALTSFLNA